MGSYWSSPASPKKTSKAADDIIDAAASTMSLSPPIVSEQHKKKFDFPKVELHLHLDGSVRFSTLLDVSHKRSIPIKDPETGHIANTEAEVRALLVTHTPADLSKVLAPFEIFLPVVRGCAEAVERMAYELCEDQAANGVIYFEGRYAPHLLTGEQLDAAGVVAAVKKGFDRGETDFGVVARSILCAIRGLDEFTDDVLKLATELPHLGVIAIDVAGSAHGADEQYEENVVAIFQKAFERGIHRTVHAGESGGPKEMQRALTDMHAERIGHGYRVMLDPQMYQDRFVSDRTIHLEACPFSSVMTGAVPLDWKNHPVVTWAKDDVNFSISRDDPTCFDNSMMSELALAQNEMNLTTHQLWKTQLNAAKSCFLPDDEKAVLVAKIEAAEPKQP